MAKLQKTIFWLFAALLFFVPLVLWPYTSEVFEFNKMVLVYLLTTLIVAVWLMRSFQERKIIFRRTILDIPLLIFLGSQLISTLLSIDPTTSWLGYYSRFNGGLLSNICYTLLFWGFVSNFDKEDSGRLINYSLLPSALLVSVYGIAEHFGIDKGIWVQDVQSRVFSTLGQPNWLAAWLIALIPISWQLTVSKINLKSRSFWSYFLLSIILFWTLIFTKSRSGLLGFIFVFVIFWSFYFWSKLKRGQKLPWKGLFIVSASLICIALISGTEYTPSVKLLLNKGSTAKETSVGPALETGGTESGAIRKIVWKGAIEIWKHYPVFGTGPETIGYSYYQFRPVEHNLVSEWDFIYNKAHNEYLNFAANSGTVGLLSYLAFVGFSVWVFVKNKDYALLSGYSGLLISNFFGFSVVPTQLILFLFPAMSVCKKISFKKEPNNHTSIPKLAAALTVIATFLLIVITLRYWRADTYYNLGKSYNGASKPDLATKYLTLATNLEPNQAIYHSELATSYANIALGLNNAKKN